MKKSALFVFLFTFLCVSLSIRFKDEIKSTLKSPFLKISSALTDAQTLIWSDKLALYKENENLKKELSKKDYMLTENELLKKENDELNQLLNLKKQSNPKNIINANVIKVNTEGDFFIVIDCGSTQNVKYDDVVVWGDALAGKVSRVFNQFSYVTPITSPNNEVGIQNSDLSLGLLRGELSLYKKNMCALSFFSENEIAKNGDVISTSGLSSIYPKHLLVGTVLKENGKTLLKTEVDFFKIRTLSVIISEQ